MWVASRGFGPHSAPGLRTPGLCGSAPILDVRGKLGAELKAQLTLGTWEQYGLR